MQPTQSEVAQDGSGFLPTGHDVGMTSDWKGRLARAGQCQQRGQSEQAGRIYEQLTQQHPQIEVPWCHYGVWCAQGGQLEKAVQCFEKVLALNPKHIDGLNNLGVLLRRMHQYERAEQLLQQGCRWHPQGAELHYNLGVLRIDMGREKEAVAPLKTAVQQAPRHIQALANLCRVLHTTGRTDEAIPYGERALEIKDEQACQQAQQSGLSQLALRPKRLDEIGPLSPENRDRNVIAFCLWGSHDRYTLGAVANAQLAGHLFPEWRCRFYCDHSVPSGIVRRLKLAGAQVVLVDKGKAADGPYHTGRFWRFEVADDPKVDRFLCRDCDSRPSCQERLAVDEWLGSGKPFHVLRDAPFHTELILAGLWGGVAGVLPPLDRLLLPQYVQNHDPWRDQVFLRERIWPLIRDHHVAHDSYYRIGDSRPFPPWGQRPSHLHVGAGEPVEPWIAASSEASQMVHTGAEIRVKRCRHAVMAYFGRDRFIGKSLDLYGEWAQSELSLLEQLLRDGDVVLDVGANIGSHTLFFAQRVGRRGRVVALEPEPSVYALLTTNVTLNELDQVQTIQCAAAHRRGWVAASPIPRATSSDGEVNMGACSLDLSRIRQSNEGGAGHKDLVPTLRLDDIDVARCRLVKVDVEGAEAYVLQGARQLLARHKPILFVENNREEGSRQLIEVLGQLGYGHCFWSITPYYSPHNFAGNPENVFPGVFEANMLCLPTAVDTSGVALPRVEGPDDTWLAAARRMQQPTE